MNDREQMVQRFLDTIDRGDHEGLREFFAEDVYYERPRFPPLVGVDAMVRFYRDERPIVSGKHFPEQIIANDACGAAWGRLRGTSRDGTTVDIVFADVYEFDASGRICKRRGYVFDAAGLKL